MHFVAVFRGATFLYPMDGHLVAPEWSTSIHMMVTHHPHDGHPPTLEWPPIISRRVTTTVVLTVTNYLPNCQPEVELEYSAAQLVFKEFLQKLP